MIGLGTVHQTFGQRPRRQGRFDWGGSPVKRQKELPRESLCIPEDPLVRGGVGMYVRKKGNYLRSGKGWFSRKKKKKKKKTRRKKKKRKKKKEVPFDDRGLIRS